MASRQEGVSPQSPAWMNTIAAGAGGSIQEIFRLQSLRGVHIRHVRYVLGNQRFDLHFEAVGKHSLDFPLPIFAVLKPRVGGDLPGAGDIAVGQVDLHIVTQLAAFIVPCPQSDELRLRNGHAPALKGEGDRTLLDDTVDVVPPWIAIQQAIDGAIARASETIRNLDWFEVKEMRGNIQDGAVAWYQVKIAIGFRVLSPEDLQKE